VFRVHLDGSNVGFLAWDLLDQGVAGVARGTQTTLRWKTGAPASDDNSTTTSTVAIDRFVASEADGSGKWVGVVAQMANTGSYLWDVPHTPDQAKGAWSTGSVILRIRSVEEPDVEHVGSFPLL
jgi:hypothetical protein